MINIDFNMTRDYCRSWTAIDALREISQNALDSGKEYKHTVIAGKISIFTYNAELTPDVFSLGQSVKTGNAIGKFGEGFKIAMLVLTRLGLEPEIRTNNLVVKGEFKQNSFTGLETFNLLITETMALCENIEFTCNFDSWQINQAELEDKITQFSTNPLSKPDVCEMLKNRPGKIYVNGLYVCHDKRLKYGYNFAPDHIELNRDRDVAIGLESTLAQYYTNHVDPKVIYDLVMADAYDVSYVYIWMDSKLADALAELFYSNYGVNARIHQNNAYAGSFHGTAFSTFKAAGVQLSDKLPSRNDGPEAELYKFLEDNKKHIRRKAKVELTKIIERSRTWTK